METGSHILMPLFGNLWLGAKKVLRSPRSVEIVAGSDKKPAAVSMR